MHICTNTIAMNLLELFSRSMFEQMCLGDLRERVASGGDPTKLHESATELVGPSLEQGMSDGLTSTRHIDLACSQFCFLN